ncbi:acyltransferase [Jeotgalicoccus sp. S0W5]|uniref:acyltransferase n=1 Tax=Jeotgalicoccus sp. S0W5 TaxID=2527874 RepID=UPI001414F5D6|nr:acyltransferase [Jeotgalicoccus sp. S0W5]
MFIFESSNNFNNLFAFAIRYLILSSFTQKIGERVYVGKNTTFKNIENLELGNSVSIHDGCYIDAYGGITIGDSVSIANHTSLISFEHTWENIDMPIKYNPVAKKSIFISSDVWIGSGCRILGGSFIESRVVIAAGAVSKGYIDKNSIYGGIPAKCIKKI